MSEVGQEHPPDEAVGLADRLHSVAIHLLRRLRAEDAASGLSAPRLSALSVIVFAGPITMGDIAAAEQVSPPTITRVFNGLEADGLVVRLSDPSDGRVQRVEATDAGRTLLHEGRRRRVARLATDIEQLNSDDLSLLGDTAEILEQLAFPPDHPGR